MRVWLECPYACTGLFADDQHRRVWFLVINHYLEMGIDVNEKNDCGYTALHFSCQNYEILELLISYGADVNSAGDNGTTALMKAFALRCRSLLENGANTNTVCEFGWNALMRALEFRYENVLEVGNQFPQVPEVVCVFFLKTVPIRMLYASLFGMSLSVHWALDMRTCRMSNFCLSVTYIWKACLNL